MNRVAVFSHYDKNNLIQDYVVYYIKELKKVAEKIIFVSDCDIADAELEKIRPFVKKIIAKKHGEYDFGSYKRGYIYAKENHLLSDCEELIFANDSCYAPLYPFEEMFNKMSPQSVDFWGVTENNEGIADICSQTKHVQSYFLVFKSQVFCSEIFNNFILNIKKETTKEDIIAKYEIRLSSLLTNNGYKYAVYSQISENIKNAFVYQYENMIKTDKVPFLKRSIVLHKIKKFMPIGIKSFVKQHTNYDYKLISEDKKHNKMKVNLFWHFIVILKCIRKKYFYIHAHDKEILIKLRLEDVCCKIKRAVL